MADRPLPGELHEVFDVPDASTWWEPAPDDTERQRYREALRARLGAQGLAQRALLERSRALFAASPGGARREAENSSRVLDGSAGTVGPSTCLEWRLFQRQARRFPMLEHPTEFHAYVLRGQGRLRVYLSGADHVGGKLRHEVTSRVEADIARGFELVAHVHNHNFMFDRTPGDRMWTTAETVADVGGGVAPSLSDVQAYRGMRESLGLRGAWVTNGLETGRFTAEDFDRLSAWE
ncbi:hypothetical protein LY474_22405 [Myxococcus stipitatus]|uniref:hypothetical protein n=1 Tax=Myxococcus stipitatus TaxID=83455 RepID=UPI001F2875D5|nr:hypothetical protein [Myxococcus stipitatus]MCE9670561.1 hypothetical protein [Myxococcus stipitatus]